MICNNCKTRNEKEAKFCFKCGSNLAEQTQAVFCAGCFEAFEEDDKFCGWCGAPVVDGITEAEMVKKKADNEKEAIYQKAIILGANTPTIASYKASTELLKGISGYKDADDLYEKYKITLDSKVQDEFLTTQQGKRKLKKIALIAVPLCCILVIGLGIGLANSTDKPIDPKETAQNDRDVEPTAEATENVPTEITEEESNDQDNNIYVEPPVDEPSYEDPVIDEALLEAAINDAKELLAYRMGYSRVMIINVVCSDLACTRATAEYAADNSGANYNEQAVMRVSYLPFSIEETNRQDLIAYLTTNFYFTESQAIYAADAYGL